MDVAMAQHETNHPLGRLTTLAVIDSLSKSGRAPVDLTMLQSIANPSSITQSYNGPSVKLFMGGRSQPEFVGVLEHAP